jgi:sec-independent protein translocase protein TatC
MLQTDRQSSFWEHAGELLSKARVVIAALIVASVAVLVVPVNFAGIVDITSGNYATVATVVINRITSDLLPAGAELLPLDWFAPFTIYLYVSLFLGVVLSSPVILYELYRFVAPALYEGERNGARLFIVALTGLFAAGVVFGYLTVVPTTFRMLLGSTEMLGLAPRFEFASFFSIVLGGLGMSGLLFTFPVFFLTLVRAGVLNTGMITGSRKFIYLGAFALICVVTPDPTLVSDIMIFVPIVVLLEASVLLGRLIERGKTKT